MLQFSVIEYGKGKVVPGINKRISMPLKHMGEWQDFFINS
jgi:hypothetical protein